MSLFTKKLNLFKYIYDTDKENTFNIKTALNDNFDKIEAAMPLFKYNAEVEFDAGDWVIYGNSFYISLIDENTGNTPSSSPNAWQLFQVGTLRNFGELVFSAIPQTDEKLRLLNGDVIYRTSNDYLYADFIDKMAQLAALAPNYFCTEEQWQNILNSSQKQSCGKFVYNSTLQSLKLPKINTIIEAVTDLSVLGNLIAAGLPLLTTSSNGRHNHNGNTGAGTQHRHGPGNLNYTSTGKLNYIIINEDVNFSASGNIRLTNNAHDSSSKYGFDGDDECRKATLNINTSGGTFTGATDYESSHKHPYTTSYADNHNHNIDWGANTDTVQPETIKQLIYIVAAQ